MQAWLLEAETFDTGHVPRAMLQLAGPVKVPICRNCYSEIKKRAENPVNSNRECSGLVRRTHSVLTDLRVERLLSDVYNFISRR